MRCRWFDLPKIRESVMNMGDENRIIREKVIIAVGKQMGRKFVPAAVSNRHIHLCRQDINTLFGEGYELTPMRALSQPGQFAAKEVVTLVGPKGNISGIRVLGPARGETQIEVSVSDCFTLGIKPTLRMSGDVAGSQGCKLETAKGSVILSQGVMVSARHLHLSDGQAKEFGLADGQEVSLRTGGERSIILEKVIVRSGAGHNMEVHLDTDEANAALVKNGDLVEIL